jgi:hypothetical protein
MLSEAREIYLCIKDIDRPVTFGNAVERAINHLIVLVGAALRQVGAIQA